jgi:hypothetical protein
MLSAGAWAGQTVFTSRATFLGAVPGSTTYDFETASGFPAAPASLSGFAGGQVQLSTDGGDAAAMLQSYGSGFGQAIGGQSGGAIDNFKALRLTFTTPRLAVGFDDLDLTPGETAVINVAFSNGAPAQQYSVTDADGDFSTAGFFGVLSTDPIASIQVFSAEAVIDPPGSRANLIDNVTLGQAVPEPGTLALVGIGVVGLLGPRRRRHH